MKRMKRLLISCIIFGLLFSTMPAFATPLEFSGGVQDEYLYEEVVFLSGEPVKFSGTYTVTEKEKEDEKTVTYKFKLTPVEKTVTGKFDRTISFVTHYTKRTDKGQTIGQTEIGSFKETVQIGSDKFELEDFQFSKSDIIDNRPAADFYSGNLQGRKYYTINKDEGTVVVEFSGGDVGYENFWGDTETQLLNYLISVERTVTPAAGEEAAEPQDVAWQGTVRIQISDSTTKTLQYLSNEANYSSFEGGHARITNRSVVSEIEYDLPKLEEGIPDSKKRNKGKIELAKDMVPKVERLIVPKFRDIGGHWAEEDIKKLYSLDVFDEVTQFFSPDTPMTRSEFTRAIIRACDIRAAVDTTKKTTRVTRKTQEVSPFQDVSVNDKAYTEIKAAVNKGIVSGTSANTFNPQGNLTRAQAITILIRALGFENKAPTPGYYTSFADDRDIPGWAKDSIYVAREIGLLQGDAANRANPNQVMTRAESSALLVRFLEFLERDLQKDYRENIMLY